MTHRPARFAVIVAFITNGMVIAAWLSRIPFIQDDLGLSESALGLSLLGGSAGVVTALIAANGLIARFSSKRVAQVGGLIMCLTLPLVALASNGRWLALALLLNFAAVSAMDVAMNAQAVVVEKLAKKPLMSSFHAMWSVGAMIGAVIGSQMARFDIVPVWHFTIIGAGFAIIFLSASNWLLPREAMDEVAAPEQKKQQLFQLPHPALWLLGSVAFAGAIGEGAISDWGAIYLTDFVGTTESIAAGGYAVYVSMMTIGRLAGDYLARVFTPVTLVRAGGTLATSGVVLAMAYPNIYAAAFGFAVVGLGLSLIIPLAFSAAGRKPGLPSGAGISSVAAIGYSGFLVGPPVIGLIAELTSLRIALLLVTGFLASLIFTANAVRVEPPEQTQPAPALGK